MTTHRGSATSDNPLHHFVVTRRQSLLTQKLGTMASQDIGQLNALRGRRRAW
jgi:hypothetical protein